MMQRQQVYTTIGKIVVGTVITVWWIPWQCGVAMENGTILTIEKTTSLNTDGLAPRSPSSSRAHPSMASKMAAQHDSQSQPINLYRATTTMSEIQTEIPPPYQVIYLLDLYLTIAKQVLIPPLVFTRYSIAMAPSTILSPDVPSIPQLCKLLIKPDTGNWPSVMLIGLRPSMGSPQAIAN
jgi:hypothetical protein